MFELAFEEGMKLGVVIKTKKIYFMENQGESIYRIKKGFKRNYLERNR